VAVVEDGSAIVGMFAFEVDSDGRGLPIGSGICDAQAFIVESGVEWDPGWLIAACGLQGWRFDHLRTEQKEFRSYHQATHRSPTMDLSNGHERFLVDVGGVSKDVLAQVARRRRKLGREVGAVVTDWSEPSSQTWATLVEWKSAQYRATGSWDRFAHPWVRSTLEGLRDADASGCCGLLATTRAGDQLVAAHFGLGGIDSLSWWFPAYDPKYGPYSPGLIMLLDLAEMAASKLVATIDLGRGEHDYKLRVATGGYTVAEGEVFPRG
jgi:CelD/BcsL family acetyltransferase involved in cellulose biosynthesis